GRLPDLGRRRQRPQRTEVGFGPGRFGDGVEGWIMMNRRDFLRFSLGTVGGTGLLAPRLWGFDPGSVANPLGVYPSRDWEKVYRDQYKVDGWFSWVCAPNDTHNCLLRAYTRNGVVLRSESGYECGRVKDLYGNTDTRHWNPRSCSKGESQQRR